MRGLGVGRRDRVERAGAAVERVDVIGVGGERGIEGGERVGGATEREQAIAAADERTPARAAARAADSPRTTPVGTARMHPQPRASDD